MPEDIRRAASNLGWGVRSVIRSANAGGGSIQLTAVTGEIALPDDRVLTIKATQPSPGVLSVVATVQPFGDRPREDEFVTELARVLAGPPARPYGGRFELPPP